MQFANTKHNINEKLSLTQRPRCKELDEGGGRPAAARGGRPAAVGDGQKPAAASSPLQLAAAGGGQRQLDRLMIKHRLLALSAADVFF